jgi:hypothetical protein
MTWTPRDHVVVGALVALTLSPLLVLPLSRDRARVQQTQCQRAGEKRC